MIEDILAGIAASPVAAGLRASRIAYPIVNTAHIVGLAALFGTILALDLRLLGFFARVPADALAAMLPRIAAAGLALAAITGALLFSVQPADYAVNPAFQLKVALVLIGTLHALVLHRTAGWRGLRAGAAVVPRGIQVSALLSIVIWTAAIVCGRFIAFE